MKLNLLNSKDPTFLVNNPTVLDLDTGEYNLIVNLTYGGSVPIPYSMYLVTETDKSNNKYLTVET